MQSWAPIPCLGWDPLCSAWALRESHGPGLASMRRRPWQAGGGCAGRCAGHGRCGGPHRRVWHGRLMDGGSLAGAGATTAGAGRAVPGAPPLPIGAVASESSAPRITAGPVLSRNQRGVIGLLGQYIGPVTGCFVELPFQPVTGCFVELPFQPAAKEIAAVAEAQVPSIPKSTSSFVLGSKRDWFGSCSRSRGILRSTEHCLLKDAAVLENVQFVVSALLRVLERVVRIDRPKPSSTDWGNLSGTLLNRLIGSPKCLLKPRCRIVPETLFDQVGGMAFAPQFNHFHNSSCARSGPSCGQFR